MCEKMNCGPWSRPRDSTFAAETGWMEWAGSRLVSYPGWAARCSAGMAWGNTVRGRGGDQGSNVQNHNQLFAQDARLGSTDQQINIPRFNRHDGRLRTTDKIRLTAHPWLCPALFSPLIVLIDSSRVETQHHPLAAPYSLTYSALVLPYPASLFYRVIFGSIYSDSGRQPAGPPAAWVSASELCRNFQVLEDCHPRFRYGTANF